MFVMFLSTALNLKEIPYDIKPINLMNGEQHSNEFGEINPIKKVPALHIDDLTLIESVSILGRISNYYPITIYHCHFFRIYNNR